jgi:ABC-2 type transport system ATP-binding protein
MKKALEIKQLRKTYASGTHALDSINLDVEEGDFFGLLGPNGAGKSTLINIITGLVNKSDGVARIFDADIDMDLSRAKSYIGVVPQEFNFNIFEKVEDIIKNQAGYYGVERAEASAQTEMLLKQLELWDKRNQPSRALSGGMKRRLMIARALVHKPRLLILDEPTAGVDVELRRSMWEFLQKLNASGVTIILTTHYLEEAEQLCRNLAIINQGKIIEQGSVKNLLGKLHKETYSIDTVERVDDAMLARLHHLDIVRIEDTVLEMSIQSDHFVNDVMLALNKEGIHIQSIRSKTNRLEELFVNLTHNTNV